MSQSLQCLGPVVLLAMIFFTDRMFSRGIVYCVQGMKLPSGGEEGIGRKGKVS